MRQLSPTKFNVLDVEYWKSRSGEEICLGTAMRDLRPPAGHVGVTTIPVPPRNTQPAADTESAPALK